MTPTEILIVESVKGLLESLITELVIKSLGYLLKKPWENLVAKWAKHKTRKSKKQKSDNKKRKTRKGRKHNAGKNKR
ncbi:MAG: hypothetical protein ACOYYS_03165 [Chloroflexota bacterium]